MYEYTLRLDYEDGFEVVTVIASSIGEASAIGGDDPLVERVSILGMRDRAPQVALAF